MNDLLDHLAALRTDADATADDAVVGDLRRGRRAQARLRTARAATTGVLALAVGGATTAVVASHQHQDQDAPAATRLVAYTGKQLPGFTVDKVPAGFVLQGATAYSLDIARPDDHSSLDDFRGKIVVSVEAVSTPPPNPGRVRIERTDGGIRVYCPGGARKFVAGRKGMRRALDGTLCGVVAPRTPAPAAPSQPIYVDGATGTISTNSEGATYFREAVGDRRVVIQVWPTIKLTDDQLREFADGITVTAHAQESHG